MGHASEPDPVEQAHWCGPETLVHEWRARLVCSRRDSEHRYGGCLVIKHDNGRPPVGGDFRNVPTVGEIATQAQLASGREGESGLAIRRPYNTSPAALRTAKAAFGFEAAARPPGLTRRVVANRREASQTR